MEANQTEVWRPVRDEAGLEISNYIYARVMIKGIAVPGGGGFIPFCSAIIWIMTGGGAHAAALDDHNLWNAAAGELLSAIHADQIELVGLGRDRQLAEKIPGHKLALIRVLPLGKTSLSDIAPDASSCIDCTPCLTEEDWLTGSNDRLYVTGQINAAWTFLQVKKQDVLDLWPRREAKPEESGPDSRSEMDSHVSKLADVPPQFTEPLSSSLEFLQLAIDQQTDDVIIRDVARLSGPYSKLIRALELTYREDLAAERAPEKHRYIKAEKLADDLKYKDVVTVRQCVSRCRKEVAKAFEFVPGYKMPSGGLIQTRKSDGYRLNPQIRFVSISEIDTGPPLSRSRQKSVT